MKTSHACSLSPSCCCAGCQSAPHPPLALAADVDLARFMGDWYVIANIPTFIERGAHNAVESYRLAADGTIETTFTFRDGGFDGEPKRYTPRGFVRRPRPATPSGACSSSGRSRPTTASPTSTPDYTADRDRPREARLRLDHGAHAADPGGRLRAPAAFVARAGLRHRRKSAGCRSAGTARRSVTHHDAARSPRRCGAGSTAARRRAEPGGAKRRASTGRACVPFVLLHAACLGVLWAGASAVAVAVAAALYCAAHVRDHRVLPPLLLAPRVQDLARGAVRVRACSGASRRAARPAVVGRAPPPSPRARRPAGRLPLAARSTASGGATSAGSSRASNFADARSRSCRTSRAIPELRWLDRFDVVGARRCSRSALYGIGRTGSSARAPAARHRAAAQLRRLGLLHLDGRALPRDLHHQLAGAPLRPPPLRDARRLAQQRSGSRCSRSARAGTTTTTTIRPRRARASTGGRSTSPTTGCALLAALGIDLGPAAVPRTARTAEATRR